MQPSIHRLPAPRIALANARTVVRSREHQDRVTLLIACDVLDAWGDWRDQVIARGLRTAMAPSLAAEVNRDSAEAIRAARNATRGLLAAAVACGLLFAGLIATDPVGRLVASNMEAGQ